MLDRLMPRLNAKSRQESLLLMHGPITMYSVWVNT